MILTIKGYNHILLISGVQWLFSFVKIKKIIIKTLPSSFIYFNPNLNYMVSWYFIVMHEALIKFKSNFFLYT